MLDIRSFDLGALLGRVAEDAGLGTPQGSVFALEGAAEGRYFGDAIRLQKTLRLLLRGADSTGAPLVEVARRPGTGAETCEIVFDWHAAPPRMDDMLRPLLLALDARLEAPGRLVVPLSPIRSGQTDLPVLARDGRPMRVLIVEDDAMGLRVLTDMITRTGADCATARDGAEAVEAWNRGKWDIVLMDVRMPHVDGLAATRAIRAAEEAAGLPRGPIVVLTAGTTPRQIEACQQAGCDAVIPKPVQMDYLYSVLRRLLALPEG